jgi:hypothetical protein
MSRYFGWYWAKAGWRADQGAGPHPPSSKRRAFDFAAKIVPVAILVVLPKCPACLVRQS